jgi:hypothetical protein
MNAPDTLPLRDIQLPDAVSWWPPAYGWWLLAGLLLVLPWVIRRVTRSRRAPQRSGDVRALALRELDALEARYRRTGDARAAVAGVSVLLRRLALSLDSREQVAALTGAPWAHWLERHDASGAPGPAIVALQDAAYRRDPVLDVPALLAQCRAFVASAHTGEGAR